MPVFPKEDGPIPSKVNGVQAHHSQVDLTTSMLHLLQHHVQLQRSFLVQRHGGSIQDSEDHLLVACAMYQGVPLKQLIQ